jgi:glycosyltransferase involved in cell wall biosynthesis
VVISLNKPSAKITKLIDRLLADKKKGNYKQHEFVICKINQPSIARAYNNGIKHASSTNILLMDSDCTFKPGAIQKIYNNARRGFLSKGRVEYLYDSWISKVIANARSFHTSDIINAYSPPLLIKKQILPHIGSYYFHPKMCWQEDSEFDIRVKKAGLKIQYDLSAVIYHPPLKLRSDLRSAFWYGVGHRIAYVNNLKPKPKGIIRSINKYLIGASTKKGLAVGIYLFCWKMVLLSGYRTQQLLKIREQ